MRSPVHRPASSTKRGRGRFRPVPGLELGDGRGAARYRSGRRSTPRRWTRAITASRGPWTTPGAATGLTDTEQGETQLAVVLPGGARAPYVAAVTRLLWDLVPAEDVDRLSVLHYYDALGEAVRTYGQAVPRLVSTDVPLVAGQFEYPAWPRWRPGRARRRPGCPDRSRLRYVAPFVAADQGTAPLPPTGYAWDDPRAVWWLLDYLPQPGETARVQWETSHTLTDTVVTVADQRGPICEWAAGYLLATTLANVAAQTNDAQAEMAVVAYRDAQQRRRQQGIDLMTRAAASWAATGVAVGGGNPYANSPATDRLHCGLRPAGVLTARARHEGIPAPAPGGAETGGGRRRAADRAAGLLRLREPAGRCLRREQPDQQQQRGPGDGQASGRQRRSSRRAVNTYRGRGTRSC